MSQTPPERDEGAEPDEPVEPEEVDESAMVASLARRRLRHIPHLPRPDDVVGGAFRIVREVGRGGVGVVFEARRSDDDLRVALKVLHPQLTADLERVSRFFAEAAAVQCLPEHPGIVRILATGEHATERGVLSFYAMEFVEGRSLAEALAEAIGATGGDPSKFRPGGLLAPRETWVAEAVEVVAQAAEAVAVAHVAGRVHRDVKPGNILVGIDDVVRIVDFGLAAGLEDETGCVPLAGTPAYMSPEQFDAQATVDARVDVFALGVVLFELLTATHPFGESVQEVLRAFATGESASVTSAARRVPKSVAAVCHRAIEIDREARFADAAAMAHALRSCQRRGFWRRFLPRRR